MSMKSICSVYVPSFTFLGLDIEQSGNAGKAAISTRGALNSRRLPSCHLPAMWPKLTTIRKTAYVNSLLLFNWCYKQTECGFVNLQNLNTSENVCQVENDGASCPPLQSTMVTIRYVSTLTVKNSAFPPTERTCVFCTVLRISKNSIKEAVFVIKAVSVPQKVNL